MAIQIEKFFVWLDWGPAEIEVSLVLALKPRSIRQAIDSDMVLVLK